MKRPKGRSLPATDEWADVVPMVVPTEAFQAGAGWRSTPLTRCNDNGQRWCALAVSDYQACALTT